MNMDIRRSPINGELEWEYSGQSADTAVPLETKTKSYVNLSEAQAAIYSFMSMIHRFELAPLLCREISKCNRVELLKEDSDE